MVMVFRTRDALLAIERIKVPYFPLFTVFPALSLVDSWSLRVVISSEGDVDIVEETIHSIT